MSGSAWTAFYWGDYLRDTQDLSLAEHGAYLLLLAFYYCSGGPLQASIKHGNKHMLRVCKASCKKDEEAVESVLLRFFERDGDVWRHRRADEELSKRKRLSERAHKAAKGRWAGGNGTRASID